MTREKMRAWPLWGEAADVSLLWSSSVSPQQHWRCRRGRSLFSLPGIWGQMPRSYPEHKQPVKVCLESRNFQAFGRNLPVPTQAMRGCFQCALKSTNRSLFTSASSGQCSEVCRQKTIKFMAGEMNEGSLTAPKGSCGLMGPP